MEIEAERFCIQCGYDLRGIASDKCPECGWTIDRSTASPIPWEHRKQLGRLRAFWRTIRLLTLGVKPLIQATGGPVDAVAARRFRWIVVALAALPLMAVVVYLWFAIGPEKLFLLTTNLPDPRNAVEENIWQFKVLWSAGTMILPVIPLGVAIAVLLGTNARWSLVGSQLSGVQRERAAAAGEYLCVPLVWIFLVVTVAAAWIALNGSALQNLQWSDLSVPGLAVLVGAIPIVYAARVTYFAIAVTHGGFTRGVLAVLTLILTWAIAAVIGFGIFPMVVGYFWLMIDSL